MTQRKMSAAHPATLPACPRGRPALGIRRQQAIDWRQGAGPGQDLPTRSMEPLGAGQPIILHACFGKEDLRTGFQHTVIN